ncbi:sigma-70 family RNA polymerase sigma factor [Bacillus haynesii]|uniref:sigma-70 family RNA polymerase sigma factor n=1 Tax=Bacillus haynesii TaxID=1925021 RepID=UPI0022819972|nr:sigma factor [Bacillus haynesii]MCY7861172.1 RNA polymerase subunit sigma [Bacillus haynesii]MCY8015499.1 RNA polymerase subunit sigma [Bacillus haynesii]MCY8291498.1 RNA polymerase subunit sigma [Bacillus haynesii]MCY8549122.1 RNA polymerase subunit sigma [Bacillus haynesii]
MPSTKYQQLRIKGLPDLHNNQLLKACLKDSDLLGELLQENKNFIFSIISQCKGSVETLKEKFNITEQDLLQQAYLGFHTALRDFDFTKGVKFSTFAYRPILWEINQLLYNCSKLVRLSRGAVDLVKKMEQIENELGYFPKPDELSEMLGVPVERIEEVLRFATDFTYIDALDNFEPEDYTTNFEDHVHDKLYVQWLIDEAGLDQFEKKVADLIMEGYNNSKIAEILGVYPMTINRAVSRIRSKVENDYDDRKVSKYEEEIELISEEMDERNCVMNIEDIRELLDVCGYDIGSYTPRILYYIRQKSIKRSKEGLSECG